MIYTNVLYYKSLDFQNLTISEYFFAFWVQKRLVLKKIVCTCMYCMLWFIGITQQIPIDHHVHVFSPDLLQNLKIRKYGSEVLEGNQSLFANIDTILAKNAAQKLCIISTGYGYRLQYVDPRMEMALKIKEHNFLSNLVAKYPQRLVPFYGIDPLKPYALQLIKRARNHLNFEGVKLHFQASHIDFRKEDHVRALQEIFDYTGKHQIPLIIHLRNHKSDFGEVEVNFFFSEILPKEYPQTMIFAHLGSGGWITEKSLKITESIVNATMLASRHNIYFDISAIISQEFQHLETISDEEKANLLKKIGFDRLLFGSDYPLTSSIDFYNNLKNRIKLSKRQLRKILKNSYK